MKRLSIISSLIYVLASAYTVAAYGVETHRNLSQQAVANSVLLSDDAILSALGLKPLYGLNDRRNEAFPNSNTILRDIFDLVGDGAVFEDNFPRVTNHFYNPRTNSAILPAPFGHPSPDWALEEQTTYIFPVQQNNSFRDARECFRSALTESTQQQHGREWGCTFQSLGQIMHHLQDMAQPQHVRLDQHLELIENWNHWPQRPSLYEHYTEEHNRELPYDEDETRYAPVYSAEDTETFNTPLRFWDTDDGKGIAEYTNCGFVSAGTNFDKYDPVQYPLPEIGAEWVEDKTDLCLEISLRNHVPLPTGPGGQTLPCLMTFISTYVGDAYRPNRNALNKRTSTYSIFTADLRAFNEDGIQVYTLNKFNFFDAYQFLIPRAVGYSAGLINYFFRGKINVVPNDQVAGQDLIKNEGTELLKGTFFLYYDATDGKRYPVLRDATGQAAGWTTPPDGLAADATMPLPVFLPPPDAAVAGEYMLVFRGTMGEEPDHAVTGRVVRIEHADLFFTSNGRLTYKEGWQFQSDATVQYGNTDWRGRAGIVSWLGPYGRHVNMRHTEDLSNKIFSSGKVLATAPGPVLGAAIQLHPITNARTLIAVVAEVGSSGIGLPGAPDLSDTVSAEQVYLLPLDSSGEWVNVGAFTEFSADPDSTLPKQTSSPTHYCFNASGTEAVSTKRIASGAANQSLWRQVLLQVSVDSGQAHFSLGTVEPLDTTGTYESSENNWDSDLSYIAHGVAADYLGDQLVTLHLHEERHDQGRQSVSGPPWGERTERGSENLSHLSTLATSLGWHWNLVDRQSSSSFHSTYYSDQPTYAYRTHHSKWLNRGVVYLDLRYASPVLVYEAREITREGEWEYSTDAEFVGHVLQDRAETQEREELVWQIDDRSHLVAGHRVDQGDERRFFLASEFTSLESWNFETYPGAQKIGTFTTGGTASAPLLIGAYDNGQVQHNFMFPDGNLATYGSGPVGR